MEQQQDLIALRKTVDVDNISKFAYNNDIIERGDSYMPNIRPSSELRNNYNEISAFCHEFGEPVYITKNGTGDLAVLSIEAYERLAGRFELYSLLEKGLNDVKAGKGTPAGQVFDALMEDLDRGSL